RVETTVLRVADNAHHRAPFVAQTDELQHLTGPRHALPDWVPVTEQPVGERLVQDDDLARRWHVRLPELAALEQRNACRVEVSRAHRSVIRARNRLAVL